MQTVEYAEYTSLTGIGGMWPVEGGKGDQPNYFFIRAQFLFSHPNHLEMLIAQTFKTLFLNY